MPDWRLIIRQRLAGLDIRPVDEIDIVEELAQHVEDRYTELTGAGVPDEEAVGRGLAELDGQTLAEELMESLIRKQG